MPPMPRMPRKPLVVRQDRPDGNAAHVETLNRELYTVTEAARLLGVQASKLRRWLDGFTVGDRFYEPVIRPEPTGSNTVTWAEFVEAGFLNQYRTRKVSLQHMRPIIERMREEFGVPYPLAHFKPLVDSRSREWRCCIEPECAGEAQQSGGSPSWKGARRGRTTRPRR
jgi:hypothetical protein